jgi:leader peptidase (prepilin peptidase)/N-methyltransferase
MHRYLYEISIVPTWFTALVGIAFGASFASFLGVVGERVPRGETLGGRSHCVCGADLGAANIPVFGWLFLRGRARCCNAVIPVRYVLVEVFLAAAWAFILSLHQQWYIWAPSLVLTAGAALAFSWRRPATTNTTG